MRLTKEEKANLILAMEYMMRNCATDVPEGWLMCGVADGDLKYGETDKDMVDEYYTENESFKEIVECFTRNMPKLKRVGLSKY